MSRSGARIPVAPHYSGFDISAFPTWREALSRVRTGTGDAKLLAVGDSKTKGNSNYALTTSWPGALSQLLNKTATPVANGLTTLPLASATDTRFTAGAGWPLTRNYGFGGFHAWQVTAPAGSLVFNDPTILADRFDVYYMTNASFGNLAITATGGATANFACTSGVKVDKVTVSAAAALTTNTLTIDSTGGACYIIAIEPWLSTKSTVRIGNGGGPSSASGNWITGTPWSGKDCIKAYAPDLTIITHGTNDAVNGVSLSTYRSNMQQIIDAARVSGDVAVMTIAPSTGAVYTKMEPKYSEILRTMGVPVIDLWQHCGGDFNTYNDMGFMLDDRHPNSSGYWDVANLISDAIESM
jgi:lysophospholipase L1-like esterase